MRVTMLESMTATVDGVQRLDLEAGESYDVGDGVGANLVEAGKAEQSDRAEAKPSRRSKKSEAE